MRRLFCRVPLRPALALGVLLCAFIGSGLHAADEPPLGSGITIRDTVLREEASNRSGGVSNLAAGTRLAVYERSGLWLRAATRDPGTPEEGWLRLTEVRFIVERGAHNTAADDEPGTFTRLSRSLTGLLGGFRSRNQRRTAHTSTIGIRGLTLAELRSAQPDLKALSSTDLYTTSHDAALRFAAAGGLISRRVAAGSGESR